MMTLTKEDLDAIEGLFSKRFDSIDGDIVSINDRFEAIDQRFEAIDQRFEAIDQRFEAIDQRFEAIDQRFEAMDRRFDSLESTVKSIDLRLEHVESDVASLKIGQKELGDKLSKVSKKVDDTYELALENWGQIEESKVRLTVLET